jgi:long-subunit fatty acid transport protein
MKHLLLRLFLILFIPLILAGQVTENVTKVGTTSAQFLKIEAGARAVAMGGAFVAVVNDATAIYWNPSGIARLHQNEVVLIHTDWLADINFDFAAVVIPLGSTNALGFSITSLSMAEQAVRTVANPEGTGEKYDAGDIAAAVSYAHNLTSSFSIGASAKYIQQKIWNMSSSAIALDIGTIFTTGFHNMTIGMSISNFGSKMKLEGKDTFITYDPDEIKYGNNDQIPAQLRTDKFDLPLIFRVGLAMDVNISEKNRITMAVDAIHPNDNTEHLNLGTEYVYNNMIFLRAGYKSLFTQDSEEGFTAGIGIQFGVFSSSLLRLNFAYQDFGILKNVQQYSLGVVF